MAFKWREHIQPGKSWHEIMVEDAKIVVPEYVACIKKVVVADCDGILTDSKSLYTEDGKFAKTYGAYDKEMMELMLDLNWKFVFVTTDKAGSKITTARIDHLRKIDPENISLQVLGPHDRAELVKVMIQTGSKVLFVGDSLSDIEALNVATWAATTSNAPEEVKKYCDYASGLAGGNGGFADILLAVHKEIFNHPTVSTVKYFCN